MKESHQDHNKDTLRKHHHGHPEIIIQTASSNTTTTSSGAGSSRNHAHDDSTQESINSFLLRTLDQSINTSSNLLVAINRWDEPAPLARIWYPFVKWK
jgi:hypothetical protein